MNDYLKEQIFLFIAPFEARPRRSAKHEVEVITQFFLKKIVCIRVEDDWCRNYDKVNLVSR